MPVLFVQQRSQQRAEGRCSVLAVQAVTDQRPPAHRPQDLLEPWVQVQ